MDTQDTLKHVGEIAVCVYFIALMSAVGIAYVVDTFSRLYKDIKDKGRR